jgi:ketosteroid isomerase-like protein
MAQTSSHRHLVERLIECWNSGQLDAIDEVLAPNFVRHGDHISGQGEMKGTADYKKVVKEFRKLLSDFHSEGRDVIEQGDKVAFRFHTTGKHDGKTIEFEGINIVRIEGDRIVEDWVSYDATGLAARLGRKLAAA